MFGLHNLTAFAGAFKIPKTYIQIFKKLIETNLTAMVFAAILIAMLFTID